MLAQVQNLYPIALRLAQCMNNGLYKVLIDHFGSAEKVFRSPKKELLEVAQIPNLYNEREDLLRKASVVLSSHTAKEVSIIPYEDKRYPAHLKEIDTPPALLYGNFEADLSDHRMIGIVGTRAASDYGIALTKQIIEGLKPYNPVIVSGLAYGVDVTAHKTALEHGIPTIGVIAGGLDNVYPSHHGEIAKDFLKEGGGLVSEHQIGVKARIPYFPARNKIIAGMSEVVIVIEAPSKSGALITASYASEFNREVCAIPGRVDSKKSKGCNDLIRNHIAHLVTEAKDIAHAMNWPLQERMKPTKKINLGPKEKKFMSILEKNSDYTSTLEEVSAILKFPHSEITSLALDLEIKGLINISSNKYTALCA